jgi:hypothetical protein
MYRNSTFLVKIEFVSEILFQVNYGSTVPKIWKDNAIMPGNSNHTM